MHPTIATSTLCLLLLSACGQGTDNTASAQGESGQEPSTTWKEGSDYTVLERVRFMDEMGFQQPAEAFSVLIP